MRLTLSALLASAALPAMAADLAVKVPPVSVGDWTGFYLGIHGGYGRANPHVDDFDLNGTFGSVRFTDPRLKGWVLGGHAGYNWQWGRTVAGLEIDYSGADMHESQFAAGTVNPFQGLAVDADVKRAFTAKADALASARARLGILVNPEFLLYGTGGLAWAHSKADLSLSAATSGPIIFTNDEQLHGGQNHFGWVVGAGGEWRLFGSNWLLRAEYLHYDFKDTTLTVTGRNTITSPPNFTSVFSDSVDLRNRMTTDVVRGGLSYRF